MEKHYYKLSIIVPIYNVEQYIAHCVNSLINQTAGKENYEVIFVDDGSKDKSLEVLNNTINWGELPNFKVVHKTNGGLSSARNYGIEHSRGEFLWFVDSDDWIEPNSVELLISLMTDSPDIVLTSQMFKNTDGMQSLKYKHSFNLEMKGVEILKHYPPSCAVAYICKKSFLDTHSFRFKEGICFEDSELTPRMLYKAQHVVSTDIPIYHHFMRDNSIMHSFSRRSVEDYKVVLRTHINFYNNVVKEQHKKIYASNIASKILTTLYCSSIVYGKVNKDLDLFFYANKELSDMLIKSPHKPTRIYGLVLKVLPSKATSIYYFMNIIRGRKPELSISIS